MGLSKKGGKEGTTGFQWILYFRHNLFLDNPMFHVISPLPTLCQADVKAPGTAKRTPFLPAENMQWLNVVDPNSFIKHHMNSLRDHTSLQRPLDHHVALQ